GEVGPMAAAGLRDLEHVPPLLLQGGLPGRRLFRKGVAASRDQYGCQGERRQEPFPPQILAAYLVHGCLLPGGESDRVTDRSADVCPVQERDGRREALVRVAGAHVEAPVGEFPEGAEAAGV